jgi:methylglutaconyl-CoA hydratase
VARVALARPGSHNGLNAALIEEITRCFEELAGDEGLRVVVLTGEDPSFCAGADVGYMCDTAGFSYEETLEDARRLAEMFRAVDDLPKPVVAKVWGAAIGGVVGLVAAADIAVAAEGGRGSRSRTCA